MAPAHGTAVSTTNTSIALMSTALRGRVKGAPAFCWLKSLPRRRASERDSAIATVDGIKWDGEVIVICLRVAA